MKLTSTLNTNFKSYIPVKIYAKDQYDDKYHRVYYDKSNNNLKRCQRQIVGNLNGTIKEKDNNFIELYKFLDKDYASNPVVRSFYAGGSSIFLITGNDVDSMNLITKKIGKAKSELLNSTGETKSGYTGKIVRECYSEFEKYLKNLAKRVKNKDNKSLTMKAYFNAQRDKNGKIKKFTLFGAKFIVDEN